MSRLKTLLDKLPSLQVPALNALYKFDRFPKLPPEIQTMVVSPNILYHYNECLPFTLREYSLQSSQCSRRLGISLLTMTKWKGAARHSRLIKIFEIET